MCITPHMASLKRPGVTPGTELRLSCVCRQEPKQLNALFKKNYDLLLSIFNPDGWLEITFVDEQHRLGRDDKGNVFLLERMQ